MRVLKIIGLSLLIVIVILLIVSFLLPRNVIIERSIFIKSDNSVVFEEINTLKNWEKWSPWHKIDSAMKLTYSGPVSGLGASYKWKSENDKVGNGSMIITKCVPYDTLLIEMNFMEQGKSGGGFFISKADSGVTLRWTLESDLGNNPISRYFGLFIDKMVGSDFEKGLKSIREIAESTPKYKIIETRIGQTEYQYIRDTCSMATISKKMGNYFVELMAFVGKNKLKMKAYPFTIYHSWDNNIFDMEVAIPVEKVKEDNRVLSGSLKATKVVMVDYYGSYEKVGGAYNAITNWIKQNNKKSAGFPWESYVTDPMTEKDQSKWLTKIYWPIE